MATGLSSMICRCRAAKTSKRSSSGPPAPAVHISTNPSHVNLVHLRDLFISANLSCHQFPNITVSDGHSRVEPVNLQKLSIAISHSSAVVSVFTSPSPVLFPFEWTNTNENCSRRRQLVGFGRAVSDNALTASIHDVVVLPSLQRLGIGRKIVNRIIRVLTSRDIYDISALCSSEQRLFFEACGFGDDILASTTMMYTKAPSGQNISGDNMVIPAGRKLLLVPSSRGAHLRQP